MCIPLKEEHRIWIRLLNEVSGARQEIHHFVALLHRLSDTGTVLSDDEVDQMMGRIEMLQEMVDGTMEKLGQRPPNWRN